MAFLLVDLSDVLWKLKKDERERMHEAIAEQNAARGDDAGPGYWPLCRTGLQCPAAENIRSPLYYRGHDGRSHHQKCDQLSASKPINHILYGESMDNLSQSKGPYYENQD